jgi:hypothetical protein
MVLDPAAALHEVFQQILPKPESELPRVVGPRVCGGTVR